ncbi:hypothetical protein BV898_12161 [Hypsibius exemplaris]|uniref:G-protein coupled receptors family 1 profile domain-containing protein n=1 Tax=Hypsibius exemplaris TaxID=2072580 RepID=A0A1W0WEK8_HYPEX|nr:hypothetical protein BV898_12161 [Hypsibius exemplaris]
MNLSSWNNSRVKLNSSASIAPNHIHLCLSPTAYKAIAGLTIPLNVIGVLMHLGVLVTFFKRRSLINPFTVNIITLSIIGILQGLTFTPQVVVRPITGDWLRNPLACAVFQYCMWVLPTMTVMQDMVICADRWVAYLAPGWYHTYHSVRRALLGTALVTVWLHAWYMPLNILNYLTPMAQRFGCDGTVYQNYRSIVSIVVGSGPEVLVYGSYPILLLLLWRRRILRGRRRTARVTCSTQPTFSVKISTTPSHSGLSRMVRDGQTGRRKITEAEHGNNKLAMALLTLKLIAIILNAVPARLLTDSGWHGRQPPWCTWDVFHISEQFLGSAQLLEPLLYLLTLRGFRREFCEVFSINIAGRT